MSNIIQLETNNLTLSFNRLTGSLEGVYSKASDWNILNRPHLALSWRLMMPLNGRRNNNAWGHKQNKSPKCLQTGTSVTFIWDGIASEFGGEHDIEVTTICEIVA